MKIAILGYGVEGKSIEKYFKNDDITIFNDFTKDDIASYKLDTFDLVFRSPSVSPHFKKLTKNNGKNWTSATEYFFKNCPAKIIGVTGTKGKGTVCSMTTSLLKSLGFAVHLVGNIGIPALDILDKVQATDVVVYEMSSFQLWDLKKSPSIAGILRIEPDHLDIHKDYADYLSAKSHITKYQKANDFCVAYLDDHKSINIARQSKGTVLTYPVGISKVLLSLLNSLTVPGYHNRENLEAALLLTYAYYQSTHPEEFGSEEDFFKKHQKKLKEGIENYHSLPHRIEFVRELNSVKYYDDNYSSAYPALDVAISAFEEYPTILIAGGKDRGLDLSEMKTRIFSAPNIKKTILIGETKKALSTRENPRSYLLAETLDEAVNAAREIAENFATEKSPAIVLMSPGAASFDMFKNFEERGQKFQELVKRLK
ncbi:UDP-N-acetylmuramoyl-L-alanine--D-glutamate ligase [Candidatus Saccharibacteria bacterium]|nr:UDP-N-acetylmuramoyl-L-alanine--D-glutamate ligase [Candidatus Saccharibacteria bacterium]